MKKYFKRKIKLFGKTIFKAKQQGVALVITMMVMLTLVLISLSLVVQSNTEHLISQNEQDSFKALGDAEWAIDYANRTIRTYVVTVRPSDLDGVLNGSVKPTGVANILGFKNNFDSSMSRLEIDDDTEETVSGIDSLASFPGISWEVFRLGIDENNDNHYDGNIRTVVYARVFDNYDPNADTDDFDKRIRIEVRTVYPVYVDSDGEEEDFGGFNVVRTRGQSERHLVARFAPVGSVAIRSDSDMEVEGSLEICGECGSAHANGTMTWEGPSACGSVTGTDGFVFDGGNILGDQGTQPEIYIPIVNPYNSIFNPPKSVFNTVGDPAVPAYLQCAGPTADDPGNSKYFALVKADSNTMYIYKAYRNFGDTGTGTEPPPDTRWVWRLIGNSDDQDIDTIRLDNCGRVVDCGVTGCSPDAIWDGAVWNDADEGVNGQNNTFYGWNPDNQLTPEACFGTDFETIPNTPYTATVDGSGSDQNDWVVNDFPQVATVTTHTPGSAGSLVKSIGNPRSTSCSDPDFTFGPACLYTQPLPGVRAVQLNAGTGLYDTVDTGDNTGDWDTTNALDAKGSFTATGNDVYSPMWNAVIFVYGDADFGGNVGTLFYNDGAGDPAATVDIDDIALNNTWRISVITFGNLRAGGTVNVNPPGADPNFRWAAVAGRDLRMHGNANDLDCHDTDCNGDPTGTQQNFAGAYLAHESVGFNGTIGVNGFVIAEDRASCSEYETGTKINGSLDIHYDCNNPSDIWSTESVRMRDWEESQRVQ